MKGYFPLQARFGREAPVAKFPRHRLQSERLGDVARDPLVSGHQGFALKRYGANDGEVRPLVIPFPLRKRRCVEGRRATKQAQISATHHSMRMGATIIART